VSKLPELHCLSSSRLVSEIHPCRSAKRNSELHTIILDLRRGGLVHIFLLELKEMFNSLQRRRKRLHIQGGSLTKTYGI